MKEFEEFKIKMFFRMKKIIPRNYNGNEE